MILPVCILGFIFPADSVLSEESKFHLIYIELKAAIKEKNVLASLPKE